MRLTLMTASVSALALFGAGAVPTAASAQANQNVTVGEVVVTAERREQSVQKSSLAISVVTADAVKEAGVTQVRDLTKLEPGVQIGQGGPATQIYIRGVGDFGSTPVTNPAVATHVDGIYVARANSIEGNFYDLERIEVLKGPQGTLYGRNATGGAINIITAKPKLGSFGGNLEVELGDYSLVHTTGAINVPIGDSLAIRGAFDQVSRNGYSAQGFDDDHHQSFRLQSLWKPTDDISLRLSADYTHVNGLGPGYLIKGPLDPTVAAGLAAMGVTLPTSNRVQVTDPSATSLYYGIAAYNGLCAPSALLATVRTSAGPATPYPVVQGACPAGFSSLVLQPDLRYHKMNNKFYNYSAEFNWNLGFATLTVLPGYRRARNDYVTYPTIGYDDAGLYPERSDESTLEVRLGNSTPKLTWVTGLYYFRELQNAASGVSGNSFVLWGPQYSYAKLDTISKAVFGQVTYSLTDQLRLIGGLRYAQDNRRIDGLTFQESFPVAGLPYTVAGACYNGPSICIVDQYSGAKEWKKVTYKVGAEYDLTPANMLFVTYGTGVKAGGFNQSSARGAANVASFYNPEKLAALEVGARNRFLDNRLQANVEGFYWKYRDAQEIFSFQNAAGSPAFGYTNAGQATMYGVDLDIIGRVTEADTVRFSVEYLHSKFNKFVYTTGGLSKATTGCLLTNNPDGTQTVDCTGRPLIRSPKWSGTARYNHVFNLDNGGTIDAAWSAQFATERWGGVEYIPAVKFKGYISHDVSVTYHNPEKTWEVSAYVRNLNNALVYTGSYDVPSLFPSLVVSNLAAPRTFGVRLGVNF